MKRFLERVGFVLLLTAATLTATAGQGAAHAGFVSSDPEPGTELAAAPGVVVLRFTEPLNTRLSRATVVAPDGSTFQGTASGEREVRVRLSTNAPGVYVVEWTTVSTVDGHTLHGSFGFGVGVDPGAGSEGVTGSAPQPGDLLVAVARWGEYIALLAAVGMLLLRRLGGQNPALEWVRPRLRVVVVAGLLAGIAVVLGEALLAASGSPIGATASFLSTGLPGVARSARLLAELLAVAAAIARPRLLAGPVTVAMVALAASGHAAAVRPQWWGVTVDALHLLSAGLWAGGILGLATLRPTGGWREGEGRSLLDRFTRVALPAFAVTVGLGALRGVQELSTPADLFQTSYGLILSAKVAGVLAMVPLSWLAWRRVTGSVRLEAALAVAVVGAAALLAAYPLPPGRAVEGDEAEETSASISALPQVRDLTMGGSAGEVLIGLTVRPALPGPNEVLVYVLPLEGEEGAGRLRVVISDGHTRRTMEGCGSTCRHAELELRGGEELQVEVEAEGGGTATFHLPDLPAPDGRAIFDRAQARMHALQTYQFEEQLSSGGPVLVAMYAARAPDRLSIEVEGGSETLLIGGTRYLRRAPGAPWEVDRTPVTRVPGFIWDFSRVRATTVLGSDVLGGKRTTIISFLGMSGQTPIWFRLWVDDDGLVHRAEMRAQGHFMDHRYFGFDQPLSIEPPADARPGGEPTSGSSGPRQDDHSEEAEQPGQRIAGHQVVHAG